MEDPFIQRKDKPGWNKLEFLLSYTHPSVSRVHRIQAQFAQILKKTEEYQFTLGLGHDAEPVGLSLSELEQSLSTLEKIIEENGDEIQVLAKKELEKGAVAEVLIRSQKNGKLIESRVAMICDSQFGRNRLSSLLSTRKQEKPIGKNNKKASQKNELKEPGGKIALNKVYFNSQGKICRGPIEASKLVSLVDIPPNRVNKLAWLSGFISRVADYILLVIDPLEFSQSAYEEYFDLVFTLGLPLFLVFVKPDRASSSEIDMVRDFLNLQLTRRGKICLKIKTNEDVILASRTFANFSVVPMLSISKNLKKRDFLASFLHLLHQPK